MPKQLTCEPFSVSTAHSQTPWYWLNKCKVLLSHRPYVTPALWKEMLPNGLAVIKFLYCVFLSHYIWHFWNWVLLHSLSLWKWSGEMRLNRDVEATGRKRKGKSARRKLKLKCYFSKWLLWLKQQTISMQVNYWPVKKAWHEGCATYYWRYHSHKSFPQGPSRHCSTTDQHKIFPGDWNGFLWEIILVCGVAMSS